MGRRQRKKYRGPWPTDDLGVDRGQVVQLLLGNFNSEGEAEAEYKGFPVAVTEGIPDEKVMAEITRRFPESLAARVVGVSNPSDDRVEAPCQYFSLPGGSGIPACTGCQWQHIQYERQLELKRDVLSTRIRETPSLAGAEILPTLPSPLRLGYRNHARFTVKKKGVEAGAVGYVNRTTRQFLRIEKCLLMNDPINHALARLQDKAQGMSQISVRAGSNSGDRLVQPTLKNPDIDLESGQSYLMEEILGIPFRIAASSFFQVNSAQVENVIEILRSLLDLKRSDLLIDAYCGVGTFAVLLAPYAAQVIGVEYASSAITDARRNAEGHDNVSFLEGRTEEVLFQLEKKADAVVLDPPRAGCEPEVLKAVIKLAPERVAMVSCDPETLVRDLALLCQGPFVLQSVQPVDMFPQTRHVEAVASLRRSI